MRHINRHMPDGTKSCLMAIIDAFTMPCFGFIGTYCGIFYNTVHFVHLHCLVLYPCSPISGYYIPVTVCTTSIFAFS